LSLGYAGESSKYPTRPTVIEAEEEEEGSHQDHPDQRHLVKNCQNPQQGKPAKVS
jgi:hypothetical protein